MLCTLFPLTKTNTAFEVCTFHFAGLDFCAQNMWRQPNESVNMGKLLTLALDCFGTPTCLPFRCFGSETAQ